MWKIFSILCFFLLFAGQSIGQKVYKNYQDGRLYIKLKSYVNRKTGEAFLSGKITQDKLPFFQQPDPKFGITQIKPAFKGDAGEKLNSTMILEFKNIGLVEELIKSLQYDPLVEYAEKVPLDRLFLEPNDPQYTSQYHLSLINAATAWNYASTGSNIVIAIIDDAIERNHPDLSSNIWFNPGEIANNGIDDDGNGYIDDINGWDVAANTNVVDPPGPDFDHGTHVAGISSASTNNNVGVASIGFSSKIMCIKATTSSSSISAGYQGVIYAANNGAQIINMSWGGTESSVTAQNVINYALGKGCLLVAAAGNDNSSDLFYPAAYDGVIAVASTTSTDSKSSFSNYGSWIDISAPGSNIRSTTVSATYGNLSGTSMASPMVAGLLALMKYLNPTMPNDDLINCLYSSADNIESSNASFVGQLGAGRINAGSAMGCVSASLQRSPIADFSVNNTNIRTGAEVLFTDRSSYRPETWQWSFPGGNPASFTGKRPPTIIYNAVGEYDVSLTVTNPFGNNTVTKQKYIKVSESASCLTINLPKPENWTWTTYIIAGATPSNYINGLNENFDKQKAMLFNVSNSTNTTLTSVAILFGEASSQNPSRVVPIRIYNVANNGRPGTLLTTANITMADIIDDVNNNAFTNIIFPQDVTLPASKTFFVSVDMSNLQWNELGTGDVLSIISNREGETRGSTPIWEQTADNSWLNYGQPRSWNLTNTSLAIHPFLTGNPAKAIIVNKRPAICSGNLFEFDGTGSVYNDILQWQLPGATPPAVINNQLKVSPQYATAGSFKVYLLAQGACSEVRIDSTIITVNPTPVIAVAATKNPICAGESATLTASGASNYSWTPNTDINSTTGAVVVVNPQTTTTYSVSGSQGTCSNFSNVEMEVRATSTSVGLTASETVITVAKTVIFTAASVNAGAQPVYVFSVNDNSLQTGASNTFTRLVAPGDRVKCELTSNEPCVVEKTVTSNVIIMGETTVPITLFRFTGQKRANGNQLNWITSSESNSNKFIVERSYDGNNFQPIGEVKAAGNSANSRNYAYLDTRYTEGKNFYRLQMMDKDGTFSYSNIVLIDANKSMFITSIYPNPTTSGNNALFVISDGQRGFANITITNMAGQVINSYKINNTTGSMQLSLPTRNLPGGNYLVSYRNGTGEIMETIRWTISR